MHVICNEKCRRDKRGMQMRCLYFVTRNADIHNMIRKMKRTSTSTLRSVQYGIHMKQVKCEKHTCAFHFAHCVQYQVAKKEFYIVVHTTWCAISNSHEYLMLNSRNSGNSASCYGYDVNGRVRGLLRISYYILYVLLHITHTFHMIYDICISYYTSQIHSI